MKHEDLSFTVVDENGVEFVNDITNVVPNPKNEDEPYVVYTDYTLDYNDEFTQKYGKLIQDGDDFAIDSDLTDLEVAYIKDSLKDEIVRYVNDVVGANLSE